MKMAATILAAAMLCAATGCEKKSDEPVRVSQFDPKLDGPPPVVEKVRASDLVADQRELSRKVVRAAPPAPAPPSPVPAPPGPSATQPAPSTSPAPATTPAAPAPATPEPAPAEPQAPPEET